MKKPLAILGFLAAVILAGLIGYSAATEWLPPSQSAAVRVDVDLTDGQTQAGQAKLFETEPEEVPIPGGIEVEILPPEREAGAPARVLIYHTHTYEAFEPDYRDQYKITEKWRTADNEYNITRVGAELATLLRDQYGMTVVHDATPFEPPNYSTAYQRSLEAIENYMAAGEPFDLFLDIHRDAYAEGLYPQNTVEVNGQKVARVAFVVGKGTGAFNGQAFAQRPDWEVNLRRAEAMTDAINALAENLCRPVTTKGSRYNQHVSTGAFLIEIGNNMNALDEALAAVPYLAEAIARTLGGTAQQSFHNIQ